MFILAFALLLTGCSSREPMDYLPRANSYVSINVDKIKAGEGTRRVMSAAKKLSPEMPSILDSSISRVYLAMDGGPGQQGSAYCVAIGGPGTANSTVKDLLARGGRETKIAGYRTITTGTLNVTPIGETGVLVFSRPTDLETMVAASKKKTVPAMQDQTFATLQSQAREHAFVSVFNTDPILSTMGNRLDSIAPMNKAGVDALKQVRTAILTADWAESPKVQALMLLSDEKARKDLEGLGKFGLGLARTMTASNPNPTMQSFLNRLSIRTVSDGVAIDVEIPSDQASAFLGRLESLAALPPASNPREQMAAFRKLF